MNKQKKICVRGMIGSLIALVFLGLLILAQGCAIPGSIAGLNEKQLEALAKIKDAGVFCFKADALMYGGGTLVTASIDKGIKGALTVEPGCVVKIESK